ncbi:hypothetical protein EGT51_05605 [Levilactobacillus suantsaiihabitans]|uniref:Uncharacterized protein n=1 Tax=Levilactobacillus suantsaiihabitans TaxID=2487722 RepID=A0A4Z0J8X8_9LACO|nr:hypothetical protein EGT51_05605 [Levilactobacillus suantsaiihabitans]
MTKVSIAVLSQFKAQGNLRDYGLSQAFKPIRNQPINPTFNLQLTQKGAQALSPRLHQLNFFAALKGNTAGPTSKPGLNPGQQCRPL